MPLSDACSPSPHCTRNYATSDPVTPRYPTSHTGLFSHFAKVLYLGVCVTPYPAPLALDCWERLRHDVVLSPHRSILCL
ncbi:hypothetical protein NDU88_005114 [Pleurodeles waltl]|uniref:Uncharacterized protein n=1 Tax=Pleurodeles waltl TaxID=8319 RepID=A0AAV7TWB9_PLEWA|nr:hypothetical protein NDU88_005114 [Pleurodeles waltl]